LCRRWIDGFLRVLHIVVIGDQGDIVDDGGHIADAYGLRSDQWVLVRPDGYVAAVVATNELEQALNTIWTAP
jgi:hypothetical protein